MRLQRSSHGRRVLEIRGGRAKLIAFGPQMLFDIENAYNEFFRSLSSNKKD